ncbi:hypothetical protein D8767_19595 [Pseudomonas sp. LTGT-11-2Z]|uniref:hypothetical protein n=1 Tax=Pseudomonas sp. LTGT-11-2Z TaxID=2479393 RepID=UPI000EFD8133|nr:hypothetical protein [Pseudomonas sp. LTGT-11-2Z]AYO01032.1 hypothetical protein D8767_19595 [Pseudomonas sp. LTGT-11-2Z]
MGTFSIEHVSEEIHFSKTKLYFKEVLSSYQNENYRSAVVMLWSVAVCDIIYKLQSLVDIYNDATARRILADIGATQENQPTSSAWEITLVDEVFRNTQLIDSLEYENLRSLQKQRHLSAHPTLNRDRELHSPNKDTTRALLRNTLEGLLTKPPFYTNKITDELLADISESADALNTRTKVNQYLETRYLRRLKPETQMALFKTFWKLTFRLDNEECNKYRQLHLHVLECISARQHTRIPDTIREDQDFYGNIASGGMRLTYLTYYLAKNPQLYACLPDAAQLKISHHIENDEHGKILGWFTKNSLEAHYSDLLTWIAGANNPTIDQELWTILLSFEDSAEWQRNCCKLMGAYYARSGSFNTADSRFQNAIQPNLSLFDADALRFMLERIVVNNQTYHRGRAETDHNQIIARISEVDENFDYSNFPHFLRLIEDHD